MHLGTISDNLYFISLDSKSTSGRVDFYIQRIDGHLGMRFKKHIFRSFA